MGRAEDDDPEGVKAALEAIKRIHASGGRAMTKSEQSEFLRAPVPPTSGYVLSMIRTGRRGPKVSVERYYEIAAGRRSRRLFKLEHLTVLRLGAKKTPDKYLLDVIATVCGNSRIKPRHRAREIERFLTSHGKPCPDIRTIRRWLRKTVAKLHE